MDILVLCEYSGIVSKAFTKKGHNVLSCDILPSEGYDNHYQGKVEDLLNEVDVKDFDMVIAFPPCTRICNSGVRWLHERDLWQEMLEAALFFKQLLTLPVDRVVVENPIPHKYALDIIEEKYTQIVHPYQFGHSTSKATCLWLKGLPKLEVTDVVDKANITYDIHLAKPGKDRGKVRSKTYKGIAKAMANQWS